MRSIDPKSVLVGALIGGAVLSLLLRSWKGFLIGAIVGAVVQAGERLTGVS